MSKFKPREETYSLGDVLAAERGAAPAGQELVIQSSEPIRCSEPNCRKDIQASQPFVIVAVGQGRSVIWHAWCLGINPAGNFDDPAYRAHLRRSILAGVRGS